MKFLVLNTDYPEFLNWLYAQNPGLQHEPYQEQMRKRIESLFGLADFYSSNLNALGHQAQDIFANNESLQKAWVREYRGKEMDLSSSGALSSRRTSKAVSFAVKTPLRYLKPLLEPLLKKREIQQSWFYNILREQIKYYRPEVILNQAMECVSEQFLREIKPYSRLLVGQHAGPLWKHENLSVYDIIISSLPNLVDYFRGLGIRSQLSRLGFEPRVLERIRRQGPDIAICFVGSIFGIHRKRYTLLEYLCEHLDDFQIWGKGIESLPQDSAIRRHFMGNAWGVQMYETLHHARIALNTHAEFAGDFANNLRLYEATGVGTLLITDEKQNLHEIFEPGREVIVYRTPKECLELIQYYLAHEDERKSIASAGQQRTLHEHTYRHRVQEFLGIVSQHI